MTRSSTQFPIRLLARAASTGMLLGVVDWFVARFQRAGGDFTASLQFEAFSVAALAIATAYLVTILAAYVGASLLNTVPVERAMSRAVIVGLLVALVDVEFVRFGTALEDTTALRSSATLGLLACAVAYPALKRRPVRKSREDRRSKKHLAKLALFAGIVIAPSFFGPAPSAPRADPVTSGHAVERVILIVVDTLRADAVRCMSASAPATPAIDSLASAGHRFDNARTPGAWTLPAVASIMTGVSPLVHRAVDRQSRLPSSSTETVMRG